VLAVSDASSCFTAHLIGAASKALSNTAHHRAAHWHPESLIPRLGRHEDAGDRVIADLTQALAEGGGTFRHAETNKRAHLRGGLFDSVNVRCQFYTRRSTIIFLISAIALAGFETLGQVCAQLMMVWQR